jgi:tripartite-type tricarboxylate transporter receptor subunit TctC
MPAAPDFCYCARVENLMHPENGHLRLIVLAFAGVAATAAVAQDKPPDYPRKPIRVIVGIAPGGGLDAMTRLGAQKISERWGQTVIVDNRPGGGTVLAMDMVAQAVPDGYTLLGASETLMMNGVLKRAPYDVRKAFIPVVQLTTQPYVLVVHPSVPAKSVKDLIALAKSKPGALSYGSQGLGTTGHIGWERFAAMSGIDILHVPYKGAAPALVDVIAGQIQMTFSIVAATAPHMRSGRLRGLGLSGTKRSELLPDLPTVAEAGVPGFQLHNTYGYVAPAGTPMAIVRAINAVVSQGMNTPETIKALAAEGSDVVAPATADEFKAKFEREYAELEKQIRQFKIKIQ